MKKLFLVAMIATMFASCYEDKGNYNYTEIMTFSTHNSGLNTDIKNRNAFLGEEYTAYPTMNFYNWTNPEDTLRVKYYWLRSGANSTIDTLCEGRIFKWVPTIVGTVGVQLAVVDTLTGHTHLSTSMQLTVSSRYAIGWALLHDYGHTDMTLIRPDKHQYTDPNDDTRTITERVYVEYRNQLTKSNPDITVGTNPKKIAVYGNSSANKIMLMQDNVVTINGLTWEKEVDIEEEFAGDMPAGGFKDMFHVYQTVRLILGNDGRVYLNQGWSSFYGSKFMNVPMVNQETAQDITIESFPESLHDVWHGYIFWAHDAINKQFYMTNAWNSFTVLDLITSKEDLLARSGSFKTEEAKSDYIDLRNYGDYNYLFSATRTGAMGISSNASNHYANKLVFFFEKGGEIYMQFMTMNKSLQTDRENSWIDTRYYAEWKDIYVAKFTDMQGQYGAVPTNDLISKNTPHVFVNGKGQQSHGQTMDYLYFAKGNVVYCLDFETDRFYKYYEIPSGANIKLLELNAHDTELGIYADDNTFRTLKCSPLNLLNEDYQSKCIQVFENITNVVDLRYIESKWPSSVVTSDRIVWQ